MSQDTTGGGQFAAFEQRPDNKLWLFYKKNRLRKAYVLAYTWHEGRAGALAAFHVALDEVEGTEIEKPEECLVEVGCTVVFVPTKGTDYRIVETTVAMSGADLRELSKKSSASASAFPQLPTLEDKELSPACLTTEMVEELSSDPTSNGKAEHDDVECENGEIFQTIQEKMLRLKKSSMYGLDSEELESNDALAPQNAGCTNCGGAGYRHRGSDVWSPCIVCNNSSQIPMTPPEMREAVSQLCNEVRDLRAALHKQNMRIAEHEGMHITRDFLRGLGFAAEKCKREAALLEEHKQMSGLTHHALGRLEAYNAMEEHFRTLSEPRNSHTPPPAGQAKDGE